MTNEIKVILCRYEYEYHFPPETLHIITSCITINLDNFWPVCTSSKLVFQNNS